MPNIVRNGVRALVLSGLAVSVAVQLEPVRGVLYLVGVAVDLTGGH